MSTSRDIARADRAYDKSEEKEPGCHRRAEAVSRNRYRVMVAWRCEPCGGEGECVCPKEEQ